MAGCVFVNVVLRYGFQSGVPATEELSRLLFVWMVFIGAAAAYPAGAHMAFTSLVQRLDRRPALLREAMRCIHAIVAVTAGAVAWGAWQQVAVGLHSVSVVLRYPVALLPLPALLCCGFIAAAASFDAVRGHVPRLGHEAEVE